MSSTNEFSEINFNQLRNFYQLCCEGKLEEAQLFYLSHDLMPLLNEHLYYGIGHYTYSHLEQLFGSACNKGHLHVAKWLYQLSKFKLYIIIDAFHDACKEGHLEIAQWLYQIEPSVVSSEEEFNMDDYSDPHIVEWLNTLTNENNCI